MGGWGNHAEMNRGLQWMRMEGFGLNMTLVLVLGGAVGGCLSGAVQPGQQTHGRGEGPGVRVLRLVCKGRLRRRVWFGEG